jgi:hypothetical protein
MSVVKLNASHVNAVKPLFDIKFYMGLEIEKTPEYQVAETTEPVSNIKPVHAFNASLYNIFCANYLSDLNNFHAFGYIEDNEVKALISFYESTEEPAWYYTVYRSSGDNDKLRDVLDKVIEYNESNGRYKFYTLVHKKHSRALRRFHWSKENNERYGYFDEYVVPAKHKCFYTNAWELLFKRFLLPEDSIVRCNFLKQEYRTELFVGGNI